MKASQRLCAVLLLLVLVVVVAGAATGCRTNPVTGRRELSLVTPQQELEMGRRYHPSLVMMYDAPYPGDDALTGYLEAIVRRLHSVSHRPDMPVEFTLLNSSVVNAFALPGHVYATRGLLVELDNEAQFAAIMAHELGHVAAGHSAQRMTRQMVTALGLGLGSMALEDARGAQGILLAGQVGLALSELSYSRQQEQQADQLSVVYMARAGWDPEAAVDMQRILAGLSGREETLLDRYLSTHPPARERIADMRSLIDSGRVPRDAVEGDGLFADRWTQYTAGIREVHGAYEKYDEATRALNRHETSTARELVQEAIRMQPGQAPFHRLEGDIFRVMGRRADAREAYLMALGSDPGYAHAEVGLGQVALADGHLAEAERRFRSALERYPTGFGARYGLATALFRQGRHQEALPHLQELTQAAPAHPDIAFMLAVGYDEVARYGPAREAYQRAVQNGLEEPRRAQALARIRHLDRLLSGAP